MLTPEFGDLDGDGDMDLLVGDFNGFIQYFENISSGNNLTFSFIENVGNIDLSGNSVPTFGDLDGDGDLDMLIGQLNGSLVFYRNVGNTSQYNFQMEPFDDIEVENNSAPELLDVDGDDDLDLILGSGSDGMLEFRNIGNTSNFQYQQFSNLEHPIIGVNIKPAMGQLLNSDTLDFIIGVSTGGVYHLRKEICSLLGDLNGDYIPAEPGGFNVLDIVILANCIPSGTCGGRVDDASEAALIKKDNIVSIEANGVIGGVQMTLTHSSDFTIEMTSRALFADYLTTGNETRLLVISPETEDLFSYNGEFEITEVIVANSQYEVSVDLPLAASFRLSDAYPNPFNPVTTMTLTMPMAGDMKVEVYNLLGQVVATLASGYMEASTYTLTWDASNASSGVYFVQADAAGFTKTQKLMVVK